MAPAATGGTVTVDMLRQAWPTVIESLKSKGRVAALMVGNASVASFDEGVLTLRFPRQGEVKGFQGSKYEELLKQALAAMFGINVVIRAVTGGGDAASPARRPGPAPAAPPAAAPFGQPPAPPYGQPSSGQPSSGQPSSGQPSSGQAPAGPASADHPQQAAPSVSPGTAVPPVRPSFSGPGGAPGAAGAPAGPAAGGGGGAISFGGQGGTGGYLAPLPPPPPPDDEDFDPDDEDMSASTTVNDLTGMALIQRELGGQIIAEYED